jgi:Nitroreductase
MQELYDIIRHAPSGLNFQPWKIKVITDEEIRKRLMPASMDQAQITTCSHLLVFCADENLKEKIVRNVNAMRKAGIAEEKVERYERLAKDFLVHVAPEQLKIWTQHNVFMALATALYGAASLDLDACPMGRFDRDAYTRILKLPPSSSPPCFVRWVTRRMSPVLRYACR